ncbi:MAG: hypothetical protein EKK29_05215 [Hyphomicrobiales bacterium]|nr:MAG: hypothetical protein EKK29_05215 [Hyphomicrobiales bacterium]
MQLDAYTKAVLTVIAIALSVIAIKGLIGPASAIGDGCGSALDPCNVVGHVDVDNSTLDVRVVSR